MELLFVMDPLERANPGSDTTWAFLRASSERGHQTYHADPSTLSLVDGEVRVKARWVRVRENAAEWLSEAEWCAIERFPIVWLRPDPPFDMAWIETTWLLERVSTARTLVLNAPAGIRSANEKLYALRHPELCPKALVTADRALLRAFVEEVGEAVLKPLDGAGGAGVLFVSREQRGVSSLIEAATCAGRRCEAQAFVLDAEKGDKRILLLDGEPLGAILRVHGPGEDRHNLHLGGTAERAVLDEADEKIIRALAPSLRRDGLIFVGIDVLGGKLTEVNVTSPTGIQELSRFEGVDFAGRVIAWCEERAPRR